MKKWLLTLMVIIFFLTCKTRQLDSQEQALSDFIPDFMERWYSGSKLTFPSRMLSGLRVESLHLSIKNQGNSQKNLDVIQSIASDYRLTAQEGWTIRQLTPASAGDQARVIDFALIAPDKKFVPLKIMMIRKYKNLKERILDEHSEVEDVGVSYRPGIQKFQGRMSLDQINEGNATVTSRSAADAPVDSWHIDSMRVREAWSHLAQQQKGFGSSVTLSILDTGFVAHPENLPANEMHRSQRVVLGPNFQEGEQHKTGEDIFSLRSLSPNSHCSGAISVVVSEETRNPRSPSKSNVVGVAPQITARYSRVSPTFVAINSTQVIQGIYEAVQEKADIINLSLGTFHSPALRNAISYAVENGVIVVCAGGQFVDEVPSPGNTPACISVTAVDKHDHIWAKASLGPEIDVAAPGVDIWHAQTIMAPGKPHEYKVTAASGTTFSSALTAGIAGLWISQWGKETLVKRHGKAGVPRIFERLLKSTARVPAGWDKHTQGAGIVNAQALLNAPLP